MLAIRTANSAASGQPAGSNPFSGSRRPSAWLAGTGAAHRATVDDYLSPVADAFAALLARHAAQRAAGQILRRNVHLHTLDDEQVVIRHFLVGDPLSLGGVLPSPSP